LQKRWGLTFNRTTVKSNWYLIPGEVGCKSSLTMTSAPRGTKTLSNNKPSSHMIQLFKLFELIILLVYVFNFIVIQKFLGSTKLLIGDILLAHYNFSILSSIFWFPALITQILKWR